MVRQIIDVIEERCEQGRYPPELRNRLHMCKNFLTAQTEVEEFASKYQMNVPDRIFPNFIVATRQTGQHYSKHEAVQSNYQQRNVAPIGNQSQIPIYSNTAFVANNQNHNHNNNNLYMKREEISNQVSNVPQFERPPQVQNIDNRPNF